LILVLMKSVLEEVHGALVVEVGGPEDLLDVVLVEEALAAGVSLLKDLLLEVLLLLLTHPGPTKHIHHIHQVLLIHPLVIPYVKNPKVELYFLVQTGLGVEEAQVASELSEGDVGDPPQLLYEGRLVLLSLQLLFLLLLFILSLALFRRNLVPSAFWFPLQLSLPLIVGLIFQLFLHWQLVRALQERRCSVPLVRRRQWIRFIVHSIIEVLQLERVLAHELHGSHIVIRLQLEAFKEP